jgi:hypothetical protein
MTDEKQLLEALDFGIYYKYGEDPSEVLGEGSDS